MTKYDETTKLEEEDGRNCEKKYSGFWEGLSILCGDVQCCDVVWRYGDALVVMR